MTYLTYHYHDAKLFHIADGKFYIMFGRIGEYINILVYIQGDHWTDFHVLRTEKPWPMGIIHSFSV